MDPNTQQPISPDPISTPTQAQPSVPAVQSAAPTAAPMVPEAATPGTSALAVVGLILAIFLPLVGLIVSIIALVKLPKSGQKGKGLAIAGIIVGVVLLPFSLLFFFNYIAGAQHASQQNTSVQP